ncbi:MAG: metallophosphoesterase [Isosphaeraceae bacterium]|nr:metallophosphoesterase [Isosphaeraceae bacterium]
MSETASSETRGEWIFTPEGAAVHRATATAVIADLHLGYEWTRGGRGDQIPAHSLAEVSARIDRMLKRIEIRRLVIAGDLVESPRLCRSTAVDLARLFGRLERLGIEVVALPGNHDPRPARGASTTLEVGGWTIAHGHEHVEASKTVTGHDHPKLEFAGASARCFLVGCDAIILPAFSDNAAGLNVAGPSVPPRWRGRGLRCLVGVGDEVLDFGPIDDLATRIESLGRTA